MNSSDSGIDSIFSIIGIWLVILGGMKLMVVLVMVESMFDLVMMLVNMFVVNRMLVISKVVFVWVLMCLCCMVML